MDTSLVDSLKKVRDELYSWAQNEEMIDQYYTELGRKCNYVADIIDRLLYQVNR